MSLAAKFWRTLAHAMTGVFAGVAVIAATNDYKAAAVVLGLGVATAVVAAGVAVASAAAGAVAATPFGKAVATLLQVVAAGFGAVVFNSVADLTSFPKLVLTVAVGALIAGAQTFCQNVSGG